MRSSEKAAVKRLPFITDSVSCFLAKANMFVTLRVFVILRQSPPLSLRQAILLVRFPSLFSVFSHLMIVDIHVSKFSPYVSLEIFFLIRYPMSELFCFRKNEKTTAFVYKYALIDIEI